MANRELSSPAASTAGCPAFQVGWFSAFGREKRFSTLKVAIRSCKRDLPRDGERVRGERARCPGAREAAGRPGSGRLGVTRGRCRGRAGCGGGRRR